MATEFEQVSTRAEGKPKSLKAPPFFKVSAEKVVRDGLAALDRDRACTIPGWYISAVLSLVAIMPKPILRWALMRRIRNEIHLFETRRSERSDNAAPNF